MNRRPSYASVVGGSAASPSNQTSPSRSAAFAHLTNPALPPHRQEEERRTTGSPIANTPHEAWRSTQSMWNKGGSHNTNYWSSTAVSKALMASLSGEGRMMRPSHLRHTRYMESLELQHRAKLAAEREAAVALQQQQQQQQSKNGSLSASSSSVSLHKMAPSHRGMAYEVVEHSPVLEEDTIPPLPSAWKHYIKEEGGLEISSDGIELRCSSGMKQAENEAASARTDFPMPPQCGIYYFEVSILNRGKDGMVGIGFSSSKTDLAKLPGWEADSWGYHGDDGKSFLSTTFGKAYGSTFTAGDVVGCGVNFRTSTAFFTKNGVSQGTAFKDIKTMPLYPSIGMKRAGTQIRVNLGQSPFMFDIDGYMARETVKINNEISRADLSILHPPLDESALIKELVAQFLRHDGYVETAKAFTEETQAEAKALNERQEEFTSDYELQQDIDAVNRQHIRASILAGDIDKALKRTNAFYPHVLGDNPEIYFQLRCRKFVEMMRLCTEPFSGQAAGKATNGHAPSGDFFGQDMEVDEPVQVGEDWESMDTEDVDPRTLGALDRMNETLRYGKELQLEYKDDISKGDTLKDIFALFAYEDPRSAPTAHVMEPSGRGPVAEELNSAILVSLGKSSSAALERIYQQTDVLIDEVTEQGSGGAFVNIGADFR